MTAEFSNFNLNYSTRTPLKPRFFKATILLSKTFATSFFVARKPWLRQLDLHGVQPPIHANRIKDCGDLTDDRSMIPSTLTMNIITTIIDLVCDPFPRQY